LDQALPMPADTSPLYAANPRSSRRATRAEMESRATALRDIVLALAPATVRQVFYQATVLGIVEKTEAGYDRVQRDLVALRRAGRLPWRCIDDNTRWRHHPRSFRSPADALRETANLYRKDLWADTPDHVEVWLEKDALAGIVGEVTGEFDVPLYVARGYSSITYLHTAAGAIREDGRPAYVYHLGDFDPSGVNAAAKIEQSLREFAPDAEIHFERLAVLPSQIEELGLPSRPTKASDSRSKGFGAISVELDAIDPRQLRSIVRAAIGRHMTREQFAFLKTAETAEKSERQWLLAWERAVRGSDS
jgi:hypothetical protein